MYNTGQELKYDISDIINDTPIKKHNNNKINIIIIIYFFINICILSVGMIFLINYHNVNNYMIIIKKDINNYIEDINNYLDLIDYIRDNSILNNETKTVYYIDKLATLIDKACVMIDC